MCRFVTPVVTAFDKNEKPDYEANKKIIDFLIEGGVDGILVLGSSGEFTGMSKEEKYNFFRFYADYTAGRTKLYAGTGSMNFGETKELSNAAIEMGYAGAMVIGPYYYGLDQEKIFSYYDTLAKAVKGDLFIYNFPARSGHSIEPATVKKLLENNENIRGLKDSVSEPGHTNRICQAAKGYKFEVYSGFDDQYLSNLSSGGVGCIGALSNLAPELWSELVRATRERNFEKTAELSKLIHDLMPLYDVDSNFAYLFKRLMKHRGLEIPDRAIFPFDQMEKEAYKKAEALFDQVMDEYKAMSAVTMR